MMSSATWGAEDQPMASAREDDFNPFLDLGGIGNVGNVPDVGGMGSVADGMPFEFHGFQDGAAQLVMQQLRQQADVIMGNSNPAGILSRADNLLADYAPAMTSPAQMMATSAPADPLSTIDAQIHYLQQQRIQQRQRQLQEQRATFFSNHGQSIPPTPQSLDMAPSSGQFFSQPDQARQRGSYDRAHHQRMAEQQDMAFTPLVSPAVTPLDPHFNMEQAFAMPGSYFSPLTSPALHAQNDGPSAYDLGTHSNSSPVEMDLEAAAVAPAAAQDLSKKARKNNAAKARGKVSGVKYSPITKPQRRKTGPSPAIMSQVLSEVEERNMRPGDQGLLPMPATSTDGSEDASVSPENLTDMPPPPVPNRRSSSKSPYIHPQNGQPEKRRAEASFLVEGPRHAHPATPASLMRLPASKAATLAPSSHDEDVTGSETIECLELPESVSRIRPLVPVGAALAASSPRLESRASKGSALQPLPSPGIRTSEAATANRSPPLPPGSSGPSARRTPQLSSRNSRKRSTSSVHASPALLPRISPHIKPLLPGTGGISAEDTASRMLMSKSNYQNILEGNTVPGVSYPTELSTNLTSKRTSHKIAEQGRRNRINAALQTMAALLPDGQNVEAEEAESKDGKGNAPNSKASVVENAIVHMQNLQQENVKLKQEVEELKCQLDKRKDSPAHP
ncbi:Phosphorus acquisition-controlling protein [Drechmeria coniospora]|uniref:Phosphorus acquisition-controlling protein n=1 Tax=Drechmeria coniospora TaxID=98403 RepID=A0A151GKM8_DRECN|nr:Phosphorus acquisition-controlling protein [Drechmeria coniospora]KYK57673.1 Phosphorus acquisition-controlling protein [Drechmeria coniospora]